MSHLKWTKEEIFTRYFNKNKFLKATLKLTNSLHLINKEISLVDWYQDSKSKEIKTIKVTQR